MSSHNDEVNSVNGTFQSQKGASPGTDPRAEQARPGQKQAIARMKWTKEVNKLVMKCYIKSNPRVRGYMKRMMALWNDIGVYKINQQRLADQARAIKRNGWLSDVEIEEIKRSIAAEEMRGDSSENEDDVEESEGDEENVIRNGEERPEDIVGEENGPETFGAGQYETILEKMHAEGCSEDRVAILKMLFDELRKSDLQKPPNLRNTERSKLKKAVAEVNSVISLIETQTITETNRLLLAGANVVAARLGFKAGGSKRVKEPWWLRRIKSKIQQLRKDISRLEKHMSGEIRKSKVRDQLKRKYKIDVKGPSVVLEELKQQLTAQAAKLKQYQERHKQYRQNRMFETNQRRLFEEIEGMTRKDGITPDAEESKNLWNGIWGKSVDHNEGAEWLRDVEEQLADVEKQNDVKITVESVRKCIRKIANWKSPGPDGFQGYWIKNFTSLQKWITEQLDDCLQLNSIPAWLTTGRTVLIVKNKS